MTEKEEQLIHRFLDRKLTEDEWDMLLTWLQKPANKKTFNTYVKADYYLRLSDSDANMERLYEQVLKSANENGRTTGARKFQIGRKWIAAASIVLLLGMGLGWYFYDMTSENQPTQIVETSIEQGTDGAILTLEDGTEVVLQKGSNYQNNYVTSNGEQVVYDRKKAKESHRYNTISVNRGKQFAVTLADGTKVWLNSGSKLTYPVHFNPGETRVVELLYGEAYFDVTPATEHGGDAFEVEHGHQNVRVLGTEFNIKAYLEEKQVYTTLVEGKVEVGFGTSQAILVPNDQSVADLENGTLEIQQVDVKAETAWREGLFIFKSKPLGEIVVTLSRWYDVEIVITDSAMKDVEFKGTLSKDQPLEEILELIKNTKFINAYDIEENKVVIR